MPKVFLGGENLKQKNQAFNDWWRLSFYPVIYVQNSKSERLIELLFIPVTFDALIVGHFLLELERDSSANVPGENLHRVSFLQIRFEHQPFAPTLNKLNLTLIFN